jgi:hypothetical protein
MNCGDIAQLVERLVRNEKVRGSNPLISTSQVGFRLFINGGIAQLVERQLCKLDVWGSNPHASTTQSGVVE